MIEEHELNCPRKPVTCGLCKTFQAPLEELKKHQKESCPARLIVCPYGCGAVMKLCSVESHTDNKCPARRVMCPYGCGASLKPSNVKNHIENKCPARLEICPNGCGESMKPSTIKAHTEKECPLTVMSCEFAYTGCLLMMRRIDMKDHLEDAKQEHIELLSEKVKEMDSEIQKLKAENAAKDSRIRMLTAEQHHVAGKPATQSQSSAKVLVRNIPSKATKNIIKSMFGPYGRVRNVKFSGEGVAVVEYVESTSVVCALEKHYSSGITVFKTKLDVCPEH